MQQYATAGAPVRSDPKEGNAYAWRPSENAAFAIRSDAVTTPCPPLPWIRTSTMGSTVVACGARRLLGDGLSRRRRNTVNEQRSEAPYPYFRSISPQRAGSLM